MNYIERQALQVITYITCHEFHSHDIDRIPNNNKNCAKNADGGTADETWTIR